VPGRCASAACPFVLDRRPLCWQALHSRDATGTVQVCKKVKTMI
jgi:hypothetical protein